MDGSPKTNASPNIVRVGQVRDNLTGPVLRLWHRRDTSTHNSPVPVLRHVLNLARAAVANRAVHQHVHPCARRNIFAAHTHGRAQELSQPDKPSLHGPPGVECLHEGVPELPHTNQPRTRPQLRGR
jgi:hypothetical protein